MFLDLEPAELGPPYWVDMYTVCTFKLSHALDLQELEWIPRVAIWFALAAWTVAFVGILTTLTRGLTRARDA